MHHSFQCFQISTSYEHQNVMFSFFVVWSLPAVFLMTFSMVSTFLLGNEAVTRHY